MHKIRKIYSSRRNERGAALLFAIGLLALMIMLCVSFSMESLQSQKVAANNSNRSAARTLAQSAIRNVANAALYYCDQKCWDSSFLNGNATSNFFITDYSFLVSRDSSKDDKDMLDKLLPFKTPFAGRSYAETAVNSYKNRYDINSSNDKINWVYVYDKAESATDKQIIGRFAYRVLPPASTTQVNLAYFLSGKQKLSSSTEEAWMNELSYLSGGIAADSVKLIGTPFEIFASQSANAKFFKDKNGSGNVTTQEYDRLQRFYSDGKFPADLEVFKVADGSTPYYFHRYDLVQSPVRNGETAAQVISDIVDNTKAKDKLLAFSFDNLTANTKSGLAADFLNRSYYQEPQDSGLGAAKTNLFFLGMIADDAGSFSDVVTRRKQIAANYIDYCDTDAKPTCGASDNWLTNPPSYTGNEKTLYINEFGLHNHVKTSVDGTGSTILVDITPTFLAELIDIYGGLASGGYDLSGGINNITFTATAKVNKLTDTSDAAKDPHTPTGLEIKDVELSVPVTTGINTFTSNNGYFTGMKAGTAASFTDKFKFTLPAGYESYKISEYTFQITGISLAFSNGVVLKNSDGNVDCVNLSEVATALSVKTEDYQDANGDAALKPIVFSEANAEADVIIGNMAVKDPRQNLNVKKDHASEGSTDWKKSDWVFDPQIVSGYGSEDSRLSMNMTIDAGIVSSVSGIRNKYSDPSKPKKNGAEFAADADNNDRETVTDPAAGATSKLSTAYIRNNTMQSMWELGFIHRGAAWETINLQGSTVTPQNIYSYLYGTHNASTGSSGFAGTKYSEGDAAILDTVKLSKYAVSWGMIDVNMLRSAAPGYDYTGTGDDQKIFDAAVGSLTRHDTPEKEADGSALLFSDTDKSALLDAAKTASKMNARSEFADAFDSVFSSASTSFTTDALREEAIAKLMPMLKTEPPLVTVFHVDIVAQTIRDVGGVEVAKLKSDGTLTDPAATTLGTFDKATIGSETVYFDDITGQVKLRATFDCNPYTGKIKLRQVKYLD